MGSLTNSWGNGPWIQTLVHSIQWIDWLKGQLKPDPPFVSWENLSVSCSLPGTSEESILPPLFGRAHAAAKALESRVENSFGDSTHLHIGDFDNTLVESL